MKPKNKKPKVSIIIPLFKPDKEIFDRVMKTLKQQTLKAEIILEDEGLLEHQAKNKGIQKAKGDIIVTLDQDCVPSSNEWLEELVKPLIENKKVVASASVYEFPYELWKKLDLMNRVLIIKEQKEIHNAMDERGCAFKKKILEKIGLFNESRKTILGDTDLYLKLKKEGEIAYPPKCKIYHFHPVKNFQRFKKEYDYDRGVGLSFAIYGFNDPAWWMRVLKLIPFFGLAPMWFTFPIKRAPFLFLLYVLITPILYVIFIIGIFDGIIRGDK